MVNKNPNDKSKVKLLILFGEQTPITRKTIINCNIAFWLYAMLGWELRMILRQALITWVDNRMNQNRLNVSDEKWIGCEVIFHIWEFKKRIIIMQYLMWENDNKRMRLLVKLIIMFIHWKKEKIFTFALLDLISSHKILDRKNMMEITSVLDIVHKDVCYVHEFCML